MIRIALVFKKKFKFSMDVKPNGAERNGRLLHRQYHAMVYENVHRGKVGRFGVLVGQTSTGTGAALEAGMISLV